MQPLRFTPLLKRIRWGGRRLGTVLGKKLADGNEFAESWEICDHGSDQSIVTGGPFDGWSLHRLVAERGGELLGRQAGLSQFPLLFKFLDANDRLSVQVHPNDRQARQFDPRENGKTEAWVILAAEPGSCVYAGLKNGIDRSRLEQAIATGTVESCLHRVPVVAGDCLFIPAGTVHAIGEGILLAEVQQASDLTFRLDDWGRAGSDGQPRPLHIRESLDCTDFARGPVAPVQPTPVHDNASHCEELVRCAYFVMRRHTGAAPLALGGDGQCRLVAMLQGTGTVSDGQQNQPLRLGETVMLPAACPQVQIVPSGTVVILEAYLP